MGRVRTGREYQRGLSKARKVPEEEPSGSKTEVGTRDMEKMGEGGGEHSRVEERSTKVLTVGNGVREDT